MVVRYVYFETTFRKSKGMRTPPKSIRKQLEDFMSVFWSTNGIPEERRLRPIWAMDPQGRFDSGVCAEDFEKFKDFLTNQQRNFEISKKFHLDWEWKSTLGAFIIKIRKVVKSKRVLVK